VAAVPTDPELLRQLDDAKTTGEPVAAVLQLKRTRGKAPDAAKVEAQTREAIARATKATGEDPHDVHVMGRMSAAYVTGSEKFLRELVEQPEIAGAVANKRSPPEES
jgi:predicted mannosyl-3-phosphoglycerate phosphatase (HAD superfamily)